MSKTMLLILGITLIMTSYPVMSSSSFQTEDCIQACWDRDKHEEHEAFCQMCFESPPTRDVICLFACREADRFIQFHGICEDCLTDTPYTDHLCMTACMDDHPLMIALCHSCENGFFK